MITEFIRSLFRKPDTAPRRVLPNPQEFFLGANLPWIVYGCDFGANAWQPTGGMTLPRRRQALHDSFSALSRSGVRLVRWFMLCDGRAGLRFERDNVSIDPAFFPDVDTALEIAEEHNIRVMFTLFDFHWLLPAQVHRGVQAGGRTDFIRNESPRQRLLQNVVRPILARYGRHASIHSWDVFNEPEWILRGMGSLPWAGVGLSSFRSFVREAVRLIHEETDHPATLGLARRRSLALFDDCSLDFQQVHWYDRQGDDLWTPLRTRTPVVLGEFPTSGSSLRVSEILRHAFDAGFAGAMGWSVNAQSSSLPSLLAGLAEFRDGPVLPDREQRL